jgi:hypothetical protein
MNTGPRKSDTARQLSTYDRTNGEVQTLWTGDGTVPFPTDIEFDQEMLTAKPVKYPTFDWINQGSSNLMDNEAVDDRTNERRDGPSERPFMTVSQFNF